MGLYFLDTSALVKLYVWEPGTDRLLHIVNNSPDYRFAILSLSLVEARSAIRRRQRAGDINPETANLVLDTLQRHVESKFIKQAVNDALIDGALELIDRYALRAYDSVQLAGCLMFSRAEPHASTFVCSDHKLLEAARSEGLAVFDPTI